VSPILIGGRRNYYHKAYKDYRLLTTSDSETKHWHTKCADWILQAKRDWRLRAKRDWILANAVSKLNTASDSET